MLECYTKRQTSGKQGGPVFNFRLVVRVTKDTMLDKAPNQAPDQTPPPSNEPSYSYSNQRYPCPRLYVYS